MCLCTRAPFDFIWGKVVFIPICLNRGKVEWSLRFWNIGVVWGHVFKCKFASKVITLKQARPILLGSPDVSSMLWLILRWVTSYRVWYSVFRATRNQILASWILSMACFLQVPIIVIHDNLFILISLSSRTSGLLLWGVQRVFFLILQSYFNTIRAISIHLLPRFTCHPNALHDIVICAN